MKKKLCTSAGADATVKPNKRTLRYSLGCRLNSHMELLSWRL